MKCRLIAAGTRLPDWINSGFAEYQKRLRKPLELELH
jgi:23S rRNA (pseudouridine1915-N3)-methyltransferase